jgi:hypothetical protein
LPATLDQIPGLQTVDIPHVHLCKVGEWNGRPYTQGEFAEAARTAAELKDAYHIPVKLGHDDGQTLLGQTDGDPAFGWVENVQAEGDDLYGDFKNVPVHLAQLIKSGGYRGRSCEFWLNTEYGGKDRPFMLKAVALLGVDAPAVEGLTDITSLYNSRRQAAAALAQHARQTVQIITQREASMSLLDTLRRLPDDAALGYLAWKQAHPQQTSLVDGPASSDIESAVRKALAAAGYPLAKGEDESGAEPGQDGPSQNVIDWFLTGSQPSCIVSDQDVDNLFEIPFQYDPDSDTAMLADPIPVKGTYTPNQSGAESGEPDEMGDGSDAGMQAMQPAPDMAQNRRELIGISTELARLARSEPSIPGLRKLDDLAKVPVIYRLAADDVQTAVANILSALDDTIAQLGQTAGGRPGMTFIRTTLAEVKRKLAAMKFPQPAMAQNRLTAGGTEVDLQTLARHVGLPETASEADITAALTRTKPAEPQANETVTALSRQVAELTRTAEQGRLNGVLDKAQREGRLTKAMRDEMVKLSAQAGVNTVESIVSTLPVVVDLSERGRDGDAPQGLRGQLSPTAVSILKRQNPAALESLSDRRSLGEKRDAIWRENEAKRIAQKGGAR